MFRTSLLSAAFLIAALQAAGLASGHSTGSLARSSALIPFLGPHPSLSLQRSDPAVVRARILREQRKILKLAKDAEDEHASPANGCVRGDFPDSFGPPTPQAVPRVIGYHVEVLVEFPKLPQSLQCRPWAVRAIVHSSDGKLSVESPFAVEGPRGRIVVGLAWFGHPPYRLDVYSESLFGRRGPTKTIPLRCPGTGCVAGLTRVSTPKPELPLRGVTLARLRASLDYVLGPQRRPPALRAQPRAFRCASLRMCEVTYADEAFPRSPFRVRYRISGQQLPGCWMAIHDGFVGRKPYEDAGGGPPTLAACISWAS